MRHLVALPVIAALTLCAAGCTSDQENQVLAGVETACTLAGAGAQIAVSVVSKGSAATLATTVGAGVSTGCTLLVPAVQTAIGQITAAGQTATVTVTTTPAASSGGTAKSMRFKARKDVDGTIVYEVPPSAPFTFLSQLGL